MSKKGKDDLLPVVIEEARLRRLASRCAAVAEDLEFLRGLVRDDAEGKARRVSVQRADYRLSVYVTIALTDDGRYDATCDHETWTRGHATRNAAINAALKTELTKVLKMLKEQDVS